MRLLIAFASLFGVSFAPGWLFAVATYRLSEIPTLDGYGPTFPYAISNRGDIAGSTYSPTGTRAFLWTATDGVRDLGDLPGSADYSDAYGVNDEGVVIGRSWSDGGNHAFRWTASTGMASLGSFPDQPLRNAYARGVNNLGQIVGNAHRRTGVIGFDLHAFVWSEQGGMIDLGVLSGGNSSVAYDINDLGHAVGASDVMPGTGIQSAFVWRPDGGMLALSDLSNGLGFSVALAINENGDIVGQGRDSLGDVAVIWRNGGEPEVLATMRGLPDEGYGDDNHDDVSRTGRWIDARTTVCAL